MPLFELFTTKNGYTPSKNNSSYWEGDTCIPWFRMEDIRENGRVLSDSIQRVTKKGVKNEPFQANSLIISTSATIGEYALILSPFIANQRFTCLTLKRKYKELIDMKYMFYTMSLLSNYCKAHLNQGNFASVDMTLFNNFVFNVPAIDKQKQIVNILDRFDTLCNDLSKGIPAEIEMRQKQYEYYRNKLLTFKRLEKQTND